MVLAFLLPLLANTQAAYGSHTFGFDAGWERARTGQRRSVRVWAHPRLAVRLREVIAPWNRLAGWRIFHPVPGRTRADVVVLPSDMTWVHCRPSYAEAYRRCRVWSATSDTHTLRHELGHALGFADHIDRFAYAHGIHVAARVCDASGHSAYSRYRGAMSYCVWSDRRAWFGRGDRRMLRRAGYREASSAVGRAAHAPFQTGW